MKRWFITVVAVVTLCGAVGVSTADAAPGQGEPAPSRTGEDGYDVYAGKVDLAQLGTLRSTGVDWRDLTITKPAGTQADVEVVLSEGEAAELSAKGIDLAPKLIDGQTAAERSTAMLADGTNVFRRYSGDGGIKAEYEQIAADTSGHHQAGDDRPDDQRPGHHRPQGDEERAEDRRRQASGHAVLGGPAREGVDHARDGATPDPPRRRRRRHRIPRSPTSLNKSELWFVPVANPDGYDFTFEPGQRLWRKNLHDNNGDGVIEAGDGVDPNRNYPTKWGYDNEGSSPEPASETYRGTAPASEPETQALDGLMGRIGFEFLINYHSAAELLLYGTGWQVSTPSPDDTIYEAMAGDDATPAVPGYDPDISAELYTTNGETTEHAATAHGTLGFTPEMSTCETVSEAIPDDEWDPADCESGFNFPDDEELVQAEFEKNVPFALATAKSAADPDDPVSVVGRDTPEFVARPVHGVVRRPAARRRHRQARPLLPHDGVQHQRRVRPDLRS